MVAAIGEEADHRLTVDKRLAVAFHPSVPVFIGAAATQVGGEVANIWANSAALRVLDQVSRERSRAGAIAVPKIQSSRIGW